MHLVTKRVLKWMLWYRMRQRRQKRSETQMNMTMWMKGRAGRDSASRWA